MLPSSVLLACWHDMYTVICSTLAVFLRFVEVQPL